MRGDKIDFVELPPNGNLPPDVKDSNDEFRDFEIDKDSGDEQEESDDFFVEDSI